MSGYLEVTPEEQAAAHGVSLHLELGRAKAGSRRKEGIRKFSDRLHGYGDLRVRILETSLGPMLTRDAPDGLAADGVRGSHAEYHLVDAASARGWSARSANSSSRKSSSEKVRSAGNRSERNAMIDPSDKKVSIRKPSKLRGINRNRLATRQTRTTEEDRKIMTIMDEIDMECPLYGQRNPRENLRDHG
jgi:hypothetical protein